MAGSYILITGGAGFVGSNLADALARDGERVVVLDNLSRPGVSRNAEWLVARHGTGVRVEHGDVRDAALVDRLVADAAGVYHFAAQVAVTTSLNDPLDDLRTNLLGTFAVLEAARQRSDPPPVLFTSTNKVYGGLDHLRVELDGDRYRLVERPYGVSEEEPLDFHSPYGCSKGAAGQYVRDYARVYGVPGVVFRMSCIYGRRQWGTEDQGWLAHFGRALLRGEPVTIFGDGHQVRDILWIDDLIAAMRSAMARIDVVAGRFLNIGGGPGSTVTVREAVDRLAAALDVEPDVSYGDWRPGDQRVYVTDAREAQRLLDWQPRVRVDQGLDRLLEWLREAESLARGPARRARRVAPGAALRAAS